MKVKAEILKAESRNKNPRAARHPEFLLSQFLFSDFPLCNRPTQIKMISPMQTGPYILKRLTASLLHGPSHSFNQPLI
jgi:hypothetical protein